MRLKTKIRIIGLFALFTVISSNESLGQRIQIEEPGFYKKHNIRKIKSKTSYGLNRIIKVPVIKTISKFDENGKCCFSKERMLIFYVEHNEIKYTDTLIKEDKNFTVKKNDTDVIITKRISYDNKGKYISYIDPLYDTVATEAYIYENNLLIEKQGYFRLPFNFYGYLYNHYSYFYDSNKQIIKEVWKSERNNFKGFTRYNYYSHNLLVKIIDSFENSSEVFIYTIKHDNKPGFKKFDVINDSLNTVIYHFEKDSASYEKRISNYNYHNQEIIKIKKYSKNSLMKYDFIKNRNHNRFPFKNQIRVSKYRYSYFRNK